MGEKGLATKPSLTNFDFPSLISSSPGGSARTDDVIYWHHGRTRKVRTAFFHMPGQLLSSL